MELDTPTRSALLTHGKRKGGRPRGSKNKHLAPSSSKVRRNFDIPPRLDPWKDDKDTKTAGGAAAAAASSSLPSPPHPIFKCRWRSCRVELHNVATLRKHIRNVHYPAPSEVMKNRGFSCWWKNCRYLEAEDEDTIVTTRIFSTLDTWMDHINEDHVKYLAMRWGDGPNSSLIDSHTLLKDKTRHLSDKDGGAVTPSVSKQNNADLPADAMIFTKPVGDKPEAVAQKAFIKVHRPSEKPTPKSLAEEILRAMETRKRKIGPGIERGGCTLVNESRRESFVQNPRLRQVVSEDY